VPLGGGISHAYLKMGKKARPGALGIKARFSEIGPITITRTESDGSEVKGGPVLAAHLTG
jgi:hypothetical protein